MADAWTVELTWEGRTWTFERQPGPALTESLDLFGDLLPDARTFPISVHLDGISIAEMTSRGYTLGTATARVLYDGVVMLAGRLRNVRWGRDGQPVTADIEEDTWGSVTWPSPMPPVVSDEVVAQLAAWVARIRLLGFPGTTIADTNVNKYDRTGIYPQVFGAPGRYGDSGTPTLRAWLDVGSGAEACFVIAGHAVGVDEVIAWPSEQTAGALVDVHTAVDAWGRTVSCITKAEIEAAYPGGGGYTMDAEATVTVGWIAPGGMSGKLSDVVRFLLRLSPWRVDEERVSAYAPALDRYQVDTYVGEPVDVLELLQEILEPFPASIVRGRGGAYVWVWDPDAPAVAHLRVSDVLELTGVLERSDTLRLADSPPVRAVTYRYARSERTQSYTAVTSSRGLYHRLGTRQVDGEVIMADLGHVADASTAQACADLLMRARAATPWVAEVQVTREVAAGLRVGDTVELTWSAVGLLQRRGVVTMVADAGEPLLDVDVTLLHDPARPGTLYDASTGAEPVTPLALPGGSEGLWDPLLSPGSFTVGGTYDSLPDGSGKGRTMVRDAFPTYASTTPVQYPVNGGQQYLPDCSFLGSLWWHGSALLGTGPQTIVSWGHHSTPIENLQALGIRLNDGAARRNSTLMVRWESTGSTLAIVETGSATLGAGMPTCAFPQRADAGSRDGWWVYGLTYDAGEWRWHVIGDMDDGAGVREYPLSITGNTWSASPPALLTSMAGSAGVTLQDTGSATPREAGGGGVWARALSSVELRQAMAWAAGRFSDQAQADARALLGV